MDMIMMKSRGRWRFQLHVLLISLLICFNCCQTSDVPQDNAWSQWLKFIRDTSGPSPADDSSLVDTGNSSKNIAVPLTDDECALASTNTSSDTDAGKAWRRIIVAKDGSGEYKTIQKAVNSVHNHNKVRVVICIRAGEYREKVKVPKKKDFITFIGEDAGNGTAIVWNDTASTINPTTGRPLGTFNSATVAINARFFVAKNMIFMNDAPPARHGQVGGQAAAFRISGDGAAMYRCKFLGYQDTLYDHKGRHYFKDCFVQGSIDFIFGNGRSLYKSSHVRALSVGRGVGSVTAQRRNERTLDSGFSFLDCNVTGDEAVYLGRAWGTDSRVVFSYTWMDRIVVPDGWNDWGIRSRERTVFYAEYECSGPGANTTTRVPWARKLTPLEAQPFLNIGFINGTSWLPEF